LALLVAACALLAVTPAAAAAKHKAKRKPLPQIAVTPALTSGPGVAIARAPIGLSIEYPLMAAYLGTSACPPPALDAELLRLGSPQLALAGQSQDFTMPAGLTPTGPAPSWEAVTRYPLPSEFWTRLHCMLGVTKEPLTVGLNARDGQLAWAESMVASAQQAATAGLDFSIGNEPDHYYLPNYLSLTKPQPGEEAKAVSSYLKVATYLRQAVGPLPLIGPELAIPAHWQGVLPGVLGTLHPQTVGVHAYPLTVCRSVREATIHGLLLPSIGGEPRRLAWVVADAHAAGLPAVISEANSVSCGGKVGVSDTPASAVWAVRFVFAALETGFGEVRFHMSGNSYDPFYMNGAEVVRRPLEGAMLALRQWLPVGSTLRTRPAVGKVTLATIAAPGAEPLLVLDNEAPKPAKLVLRGAGALHPVQAFSPNGALGAVAPDGAGRRLVTLPANGVLALRFSSSASG
jgi:hypothetical protein